MLQLRAMHAPKEEPAAPIDEPPKSEEPSAPTRVVAQRDQFFTTILLRGPRV